MVYKKMPPKILSLGTKGGIPQALITDNKFNRPVLPSGPTLELNEKSKGVKVDLLSQTEVQKNLTSFEKTKFEANAKNEDDKLPRFTIDSVRFSILNKEVLNKMKIVNVSNKIERDPTPITNFSLPRANIPGKSTDPGCYRDSDGKVGQDRQILPPSLSITSYPEMGTLENDKLCQTCYKTNIDCPGHLGEISLNCDFVHPLFREFVIQVLSSVCNSCSSLLMSENLIKQKRFDKLSLKARLKAIFTEVTGSSPRRCKNPNCRINPKYITRKATNEKYQIYYKYKQNDVELPKPVSDIKKILRGISETDTQLMGFKNGSHPKDMIMESFAVIPPCARPFTVREGQIREDHLTSCYDEIIRDNYKYINAEDDNKKQKIERDLYFHISHFIDNNDGKYCRSPTEKILGIKQRIVKKEGLIRSHIMGKRVNFCGRSVIGPDSSLKFGEVAIPEKMCETLTVPEMVHEKNYEYILNLWNTNQISHFYFGDGPAKGRRFRFRGEQTKNMTYKGEKLRPHIGFTVERYIDDGDVVLVNRQPTLYKYSMVGNFVKKVPRKNIGIHMTETKMRNADFDGDEINIHVIQGLDARVEAATFANTQACIPNSLINAAMIGLLYNNLSSAYIMTRLPFTQTYKKKETDEHKKKVEQIKERIFDGYYSKEEAQLLMSEVMLTENELKEAHSKLTYRDDLPTLEARLKKHGINKYCGRALFSSLLPTNFCYQKGDVEIIDGVLIRGRITANHIGRKGSTIQMSIWKWYGRERAVAFITDCSFLTDWFIYFHGLTLGFDDVNLNPRVKTEIRETIDTGIQSIYEKINLQGEEHMDMSLIEKQRREGELLGFIGTFTTQVNKIGNNALSPENPLNIMADSGAKGGSVNTTSITGLLGQQRIFGNRSALKISGGTRSVPYYDFNSKRIDARGFVKHSYLEGLEPSEMFFISEAGREGQLGTATTTAESGAMSHRLVKFLEDCKIAYDGSVRNAADVIYQMSYMDGYDVGELTNVSSASTKNLISFIDINEAVCRINAEFM